MVLFIRLTTEVDAAGLSGASCTAAAIDQAHVLGLWDAALYT